jgi:hypothetical protein
MKVINELLSSRGNYLLFYKRIDIKETRPDC